jgi:hypothetical protein
MKRTLLLAGLVALISGCNGYRDPSLDKAAFRHYIDTFNRQDTLNLYVDDIPDTRMIPNDQAWDFLQANIPFFECPDKEIEEVYYYRWWTFRKHIRKTPDGYVITEFMPPVPWAGKYNAIPCPAGHHFREGRWLHDPQIIRDYGLFWLRGGGNPYRYSTWLAESFVGYASVHPDDSLLFQVLPDLVRYFDHWKELRMDSSGMYWQNDGQDGMEVAIGGTGRRPTINTYRFADARAIATIARMKGDGEMADRFDKEAANIRKLTLNNLWDHDSSFFKVMPTGTDSLSSARELIGYVPWYLELVPPDQGYEKAWAQLMDPQGFYAPFGPTTAEQRHPGFRVSYRGHECQWNGPSWPFATAQTLTALANVLNDYPQEVVDKDDYFDILKIYTGSHRFRQIPPDGDTLISNQLWIDENLNPFNGDWLARTRMEVENYNHGFRERGIYYNHSTYCDLIITGLAGLRPSIDNTLTINPLTPDNWDWFCLDDITYHGHRLAVVWDRTGEKYQVGRGFRIFVDGRLKARASKPGKVRIRL